MSCRLAATARHSRPAHAPFSTLRVAARGCARGAQPSGAARLGAQRSKSAPSPRSRVARNTPATGPPRLRA
eukprot:3363495-Lingulodinium_polyedra.AAC.1